MAFNVTQPSFDQGGLGGSMEADGTDVNETLNSTSSMLVAPTASRSGTVCLEYDVPNACLLLVYIILGLGNWLTVLSFAKNTIICRPYNWLVFGMAIPDGITTTIVAPMALVTIFRSFKPINTIWCFVLIFIRGCTYVSSGFFVLFIGITRITYALNRFPKKFTNPMAVVLILVVYVISAMFTIPTLRQASPTFNICMAKQAIGSDLYSWLPLYLTVVTTYLGFCFIYVGLTIVVRNHQQTLAAAIPSAFHPSSSLLSPRACLSVAIVFGISSLLPGIPGIIQVYPAVECHLHYVDLLSNFVLMQSALNPLLYTWQSPVYRKQAIRTLRWLWASVTCYKDAGLEGHSSGAPNKQTTRGANKKSKNSIGPNADTHTQAFPASLGQDAAAVWMSQLAAIEEPQPGPSMISAGSLMSVMSGEIGADEPSSYLADSKLANQDTKVTCCETEADESSTYLADATLAKQDTKVTHSDECEQNGIAGSVFSEQMIQIHPPIPDVSI